MNIQAYTQFLINKSKLIFAAWAILLLIMSALLLHRMIFAEAIIDNSVGVWFDLSDPEIQIYDKYNNDFGQKEWSIIVLKTRSVYDKKFLSQLDEITKAIQKVMHVVKVTSITNVRDNKMSNGEELEYIEIYNPSSDGLGELRKQLANNPIFDKNLINLTDDQYTIILVQNHNYINDPSPYRINIVKSLKQIIVQHDTITEWGMAGTTIVNAELNMAAQQDVIVFYLLVSTLLTMICWLILRNFRDLAVVLAVVVTSVLSAMTLLAVLKIPYNMATVMLPPILIALSVAGVLHIITDFHLVHKEQPTQAALTDTLSSLWRPAMWASLTTIAGLSSFGFSEVSPILQLGMAGAFGMLIAWLANMTIAPLLMYIFWQHDKKPAQKTESFSITGNWFKYLNRGWFIGLMLLFTSLSLLGLHRAEVDTDYSRFFSADTRVTKSYRLLEQAGMAQNPIIIQLKYPKGKEFIHEDYFAPSLAFEKALQDLPEVIKLISVSDLIEEIDKAYNGSKDHKERIQNYTQSQLAQLLLLGELSGNDDIDDLVLKSRNSQQLVVMTPYLSSSELRKFRESVAQLQAKFLPADIRLDITGTTVLWANMDTQITQTQAYTLAFVGIFLLLSLPFIFRSFWLGIFGVVINFLPLAASLGLMSWFDIKINMATVILGAISIGVVVDDTIHMFYRIQMNRRSGLSMSSAVESSLATIGTSIYRTTIILVVAFTCMATSNFLPTAHFGIFVSISVIIALFLDLFIAPRTLLFLAKNDKAT